MKLLVFAHTPPPHHGQSFMVKLMLEGFGGDRRKVPGGPPTSAFGVECYHVNACLSKGLHEIGGFQPRKLSLLVKYCAQAIWCRFRYGVTHLYYVPAPGQRAALYRDWLVMLACRPFFKHLVFHWHAAGLAEWLERSASSTTRWFTRHLLGNPELSIICSQYNLADGQKIGSQQIEIVSNGVPDPCPDFERDILPRRKARFTARAKLMARQPLNSKESAEAGDDPRLVKLLYVAHCSREKGLFDALDAVALVNRRLAQTESPLRVHLTVAGEWVHADEQKEFEARVRAPDLQIHDSPGPQASENCYHALPEIPAVHYAGFMSGKEKARAFALSDCFCLPTYYSNENQPVVLIEAMAFGLPIVTTRWRSLPALFRPSYTGVVDIRSPEQVAEAIINTVSRYSGQELRESFVREFTLSQHLSSLARALHKTE
jgi:glycosyltransferase involved in cell wall biosynthesis